MRYIKKKCYLCKVSMYYVRIFYITVHLKMYTRICILHDKEFMMRNRQKWLKWNYMGNWWEPINDLV